MPKTTDITGNTFGNLFVLRKLGIKNKRSLWLCECSCGNVCEVYAKHLKCGDTKSCGCLKGGTNIIDRIGQVFGHLTVIKQVPSKYGSTSAFWLCSCSCGKFVEVASYSLIRNQSCGCVAFEASRKRMIGQTFSTTHGLSYTKGYKKSQKAASRAKRLKRIPPWLTQEDMKLIRQVYKDCPEGFEVDHIIPLCGTLVSGLHVLENLQYLEKLENHRKRNNFVPLFTLKAN